MAWNEESGASPVYDLGEEEDEAEETSNGKAPESSSDKAEVGDVLVDGERGKQPDAIDAWKNMMGVIFQMARLMTPLPLGQGKLGCQGNLKRPGCL